MAAHLAAAASGVLPLLTGPALPAGVIGSHRTAVVIAIPTPTGRHLVSVVTSAAAGVPNGVRVPTIAEMPAVAVGSPAMVGRRRVRAGSLDVRVVRHWDSLIPVGRSTSAAVTALGRAAAQGPSGVPGDAVGALRDALAAWWEPASGQAATATLAAAVNGLVGLGQGSTPGGDDVLAGLIAGLHATGNGTLVATIAARLDRLDERTTALSADLLDLAVRGHACQEALEVLAAGRGPSGATPGAAHDAAVRRLLSIGHTSGADLATGLALGLPMAVPGSAPGAGGAAVPPFAECRGPR